MVLQHTLQTSGKQSRLRETEQSPTTTSKAQYFVRGTLQKGLDVDSNITEMVITLYQYIGIAIKYTVVAFTPDEFNHEYKSGIPP